MTSPAEMKAWTCRRYGGPEVLALETIKLRPPGPGEVRIAMRATTVSSGDARVRALRLPRGFGPIGPLMLGFGGPRRPVLGTELSGIVAAVGAGVARFREGDAVIAFPDIAMGAHAEFVTMDAEGLIVHKPAKLPFEVAASLCFGGLTAHHFIARADLKAGERLLVLGASGTVGSALVQLARLRGAHVTATTSSGNMEIARDLGAHEIVDYGREDVLSRDARWDVIADTVAASSFAQCIPALEENGRYLAIAGGLSAFLLRRRGSRRQIASPASSSRDDLDALISQATSGAFVPLIDGCFAFRDLPDAHRRVDSGRKRGSVVVTSSADEPVS